MTEEQHEWDDDGEENERIEESQYRRCGHQLKLAQQRQDPYGWGRCPP
jgi:hypothetical protein